MTLRNSFQARIASAMFILALLTIGTVYFAVKAATQSSVRAESLSQLNTGARVFERLVEMRGRQLHDTVQVLTSDFAFKGAVASGDGLTITSALANYGARIKADEVLLLDLTGRVISSTVSLYTVGSIFHEGNKVQVDGATDQTMRIVSLQRVPHLMVEAPVLAPLPVARVVMGFAMDQSLASELRSLSGLDVSFIAQEGGVPGEPISTLSDQAAGELLSHPANEIRLGKPLPLRLDGRNYLTERLTLTDADTFKVSAFLHRPLDEAMKAFSPLMHQLFWIAVLTLVLALGLALLIARGVAEPVRRLAAATQRIGNGDYTTPIALARSDEFGRLASTLDTMRIGIAERERQLSHNALHDALTGLPNRALAMERLSHAIAGEQSVAVMYLGLERFREVNQSSGTAGGDVVLQTIADRLKRRVGNGDCVSRLVGDEFLLLLNPGTPDTALTAAEEIQQAIALPIAVGLNEFKMSCRVGVACYPQDGHEAHELLLRASIAMRDAGSQAGRLQLYENGRDDAYYRQISLIRDLQHAGSRGELLLHYQPKLSLDGRGPFMAEALLRWQHTQFGMVSPGEFIPLAERTGSITLLTIWVVEEVFRQLEEWNEQGLTARVSLNISAADLVDGDLPNRLERLLKGSTVRADQLVLEVTESAIMQDPERAVSILQRLRDQGISLSVDDYGTGYASLAHLKRLPVSELKIDQSFIRDLSDNSEDAVIVRSTIDMGHNLDMKVVAEGVEYAQALELLTLWGCDMVQGYLISRPLPAQAFEHWMNDRRVQTPVEALAL